jgi:acyl-coenzyme A thioesterase PaaI-like protein
MINALSSPISRHQQDIIEALSKIPYAAGLKIRPIIMGDELTMVLPYSEDIIGNPMLRALHGGAVGAFMETTAIVQLLAMNGAKDLEAGVPKPIGISIDFLRRGNPKDTYARALVARQGSRVANVRVRAWQENPEEPVAILHGHFLNTDA